MDSRKLQVYADFLKDKGFKGDVKIREPLKNYTTWKIGGPGDLVVLPREPHDIELVLQLVKDNRLPLTVLGNGSNVLIKDGGIRGVVLITAFLNKIRRVDNKLYCQSGVKLPVLANKAAREGLTGLEFAVGIPGTLGGAVIMNAGAHGKNIGALVEKVITFGTDGKRKTYNAEEMNFSYRSSALKESSQIIIEAHLSLKRGDKSKINEEMKKNIELRKAKQPIGMPNGGSVFKNHPQFPAGYLIEKVGAKGLRIGSAQVSKKHANFIVNLGDAKASDVLELINKIQKNVLDQFNIHLKREIVVLGED